MQEDIIIRYVWGEPQDERVPSGEPMVEVTMTLDLLRSISWWWSVAEGEGAVSDRDEEAYYVEQMRQFVNAHDDRLAAVLSPFR